MWLALYCVGSQWFREPIWLSAALSRLAPRVLDICPSTVSPEICKYHHLVAHARESVRVAVFHLHVSSHSQPPWVGILILPMYILPWSTHSRKHTKCCPFPCFTQYEVRSMWYKWWSFQRHGNEESVITFYQIFYRPLSPHGNRFILIPPQPYWNSVFVGSSIISITLHPSR